MDLHLDLEELPQSLPTSTFTDTSFLHFSMQTIELRTTLCARTNSLKSRLSFLDTLQYIDMVQRCLQAIPEWKNIRSRQSRTLLDLQLRQFLVILFTPKALRDKSACGSESRYSMIASLEASVKMIDMHTKILNMPNLALCCTRNDYYRAALLICHVTYHASKYDGELPPGTASFLADLFLRHDDGAGCESIIRPVHTQSSLSSRRTCNAARSRRSAALVSISYGCFSWTAI